MFFRYNLIHLPISNVLKLNCLRNPIRYFITNTVKHRTATENALNVNTNVIKDVIMYKYENPRFFKILNLFAICQFGFWTYLSIFSFKTLRDAPVTPSPDVAWWQRINLGENKYRNTIAISAFIIGYGILSISWIFTLRSVRYLILRKGGESVTFVTYTPFGQNRMMTVGLENISSQEIRRNAKSQLPIKIKNHFLYYILDMRGEFRNTSLFDYTVGLKRTFK
ncbi:hypothetical protein ILUMI_22189 [Ignelater luminosus]|uniref:Transmembrane protein 223 n=1 Tax=Ignelater luminosus TaxID=2038154 RepID=A0A8K0CF01_IGNLU|nr:hypothetical protein ILUMI_22189 [Ignelater luminosus]